MYRTFELLREHSGTGKLLILLAFLICVIILLLSELEDKFPSKLLIPSFQNAKSVCVKPSLSSGHTIGLSFSTVLPLGFSTQTLYILYSVTQVWYLLKHDLYNVLRVSYKIFTSRSLWAPGYLLKGHSLDPYKIRLSGQSKGICPWHLQLLGPSLLYWFA